MKGQKQMQIVAAIGSHRLNGNTSYLTDKALEGAMALGVETTKISLAQYRVNLCQAHDECEKLTSCPQEDDMRWIVQKLYGADAVILASPVYSHYVTALMKAFIERTRFYTRHNQRMAARCAGIIVLAGSTGIEETSAALTRFITRTSSITAERIKQVHGFARTFGEIKGNAPVVEQAVELGKGMAEYLLKG